MTLAVDVYNSVDGGSSPVTITNTGAASSGIVCVIGSAMLTSGSQTVSSVTYDSTELTHVTGSPLQKTATEAGYNWLAFQGSSVTQGAQDLVVTHSGSPGKLLAVMTLTGAADVVEQDTWTVSSNSITDPSGTLSLGSNESFCMVAFISGENAVGSIAPLSGWTSQEEIDLGTRVSGFYTYDTIGSTDVTVGWTQTSDDAVGIGAAFTETGGGATALSADPMDTSSELSVPAVGQEHALAPTSLDAQAELAAASITQEHALAAPNIESAAELTVPVVAQANILTAPESVDVASEIDVPTLGHGYTLVPVDLESASELDVATITQEHVLTATSIDAVSELTAPTVTQIDVLLADSIDVASELDSATLIQGYTFLSVDLNSQAELTSPTITQEHAFTGTDVNAVSELTAPAVGFAGADALLADPLDALSELDAAAITQEHALTAPDLNAQSELTELVPVTDAAFSSSIARDLVRNLVSNLTK